MDTYDRTTLLQRISDGFIPPDIAKILYQPFFRVGPTDVNGWSLVHMISGMLFALVTHNIWIALLVHTGWEGFQFIAGDNKFDIETAIDISLDTLFFLAGFQIMKSL